VYLRSDYFARVILCNSMVWHCSLTGKSNLTFQEALDSEKSARQLLKAFPRPVCYHNKEIVVGVVGYTIGRLGGVVDHTPGDTSPRP
jgi:hypothetical protein